MILQITFDDKFVDYVIEQFHDYSSECRIVLLTYNPNNIRYATKVKNIITYGTTEYYDLLESLHQYSAVIMHGLFDYMQYEIVRRLPKEVKLAWVLWGSEIYSRSENKYKCLAKYTRFIYTIHKFINKYIKGKLDINNDVPLDILKRVDYLLGTSIELFNDAKIYLKDTVKHLRYSYYTVEEIIGSDLIDKYAYGNNLIVGNSSAIENNHIEILSMLNKIKPYNGVSFYFPLSYGEVWIRNLVNKIGRFFCGSRFVPLLDFMDRYKYNELMLSCSAYIANHHRPNAFGNILTALWLGLRVFVSERNIQTTFLKRMGLCVNIIERDLKNATLPLATLTNEEILKNRMIIEKNFGKEQMNINVLNIINTLSPLNKSNNSDE